MSKQVFTATAFAALAALGFSSAAHATATASASFSGITIQVFDLDPLDGINAGITFETGAIASAIASNGATSNANFLSGPSGVALGPLTAALGNSSAFSTLSAGDVFGAGPSGSATATSSGALQSATAYAYALNTKFTLTPHTLAVVNFYGATASTSASLGESAYAGVYLALNTLDFSAGSYAQAVVNVERDGRVYTNLGSGSGQASFVNLTSGSTQGWASVGASVWANGVTAAVPEPESAALMLAGLLTVGSLVRRRAKQA